MILILDAHLFDDVYPYQTLEMVLAKYAIDTIIVDQTFKDSIQSKDLSEKSLLNKSYYHLLKHLAPVNIVQTRNFKVQEPIKKLCAPSSPSTVFFTNQEVVAKNFQKIFNQKDHFLVKEELGEIKLWAFTQTKVKAFYAPPDKYTLGVLSTDHLNVVFSPKYGYLKIDQSYLHEGGEGAVYKTYHNFLAKIYKPRHQTYQNFKKLLKMVETPVDNPHIVWPKDIIYKEDNFLGYIMENIQTKDTLDSLRDENFKGYQSLDRIDIIIALLKNIKYLHDRNIVIGDLKLDNVLVASKDDVYIIDTGSFQIDDYPCVVFNLEYSEKNFSEDELKKELRPIESEYYPINRIIFEILFLRSPHSSPDNIEIGFEEKRGFSYPLEIPTDIHTIAPHQKPWFSLPKKIRESFYYYFKEKKITYLPELIQDFESFVYHERNRRIA